MDIICEGVAKGPLLGAAKDSLLLEFPLHKHYRVHIDTYDKLSSSISVYIDGSKMILGMDAEVFSSELTLNR